MDYLVRKTELDYRLRKPSFFGLMDCEHAGGEVERRRDFGALQAPRNELDGVRRHGNSPPDYEKLEKLTIRICNQVCKLRYHFGTLPHLPIH